MYGCLGAAYTTDEKTSETKLHPKNHWYDPATGKAALITHYADAYPGDGATDLFAVTPDGKAWLYPGDGYGSFDVGERISIRLPAGARPPPPGHRSRRSATSPATGTRPGPAGWPEFWVLSGYTGAAFREATLMNHDAWARREIVNVADINGDKTPTCCGATWTTATCTSGTASPGPSAAASTSSLSSWPPTRSTAT
ncbi:hypothetical protein ACR6C2_13530 [Streptomyces sp. INA 01156]